MKGRSTTMRKNRRFLAGLLTAALILQPITAVGEEMPAQEEFGASELMDDEGYVPDDDQQEADLESFLAEDTGEDGFADENNLETAQSFAEEEASAEFLAEDTVEAPVAVTGGCESGISLFSNGYYSGSYGEQLDMEAKRLYDAMVDRYVARYADGIDQRDYTKLPVALSNKIYFDATLDENNKLVMDDNYTEAKNLVKYYVQAAVDAFSYDHPEVFWFRGCTYIHRYGYTKGADGTVQGYISTNIDLDLSSKEIKTDAHKEMPEFMESVNATVSRLEAEIGTATAYEKIKRIHDYVCELATYKGSGDSGNLVVHTAKPAFLGTDHGFVCEGYARTIKILCDRLGVNCACVSGKAKSTLTASSVAHMWNYIQLGDGNWYLVDATWDDSGDPAVPYTGYFLAGWESMGRNIKICDERTEGTDLSGTGGMHFTFPECSSTGFVCRHNWELGTVVKEPTCTEEGSGTSRCSICGEKKEELVSIPALGHSYGEYVVTKAPTVLETGIKTASCTRCGDTITASVDKVPKTIQLSVTSFRLRAGQSYTVKVSGLGAGDKVKSWKSNNTKIATVNSKGKITGKKSGTTTITVTLISGLTKNIKVRVQTGVVKTAEISLNTRKVTLAKKGRTYQLKVTVLPVTSQQKVTYTSSRPTVATVNSKGKITAKKKGTTTITATSGTKKITCKVTVLK